MHSPHSFGGSGGKRSEVEFVLDARSNSFDSMAWWLHKFHQNRQGRSSGCGCNGGCSRCCWTPATSWFDYNRAYLSYWKDMFDCFYGRSGYGSSSCEPPCPPKESAGKLVVALHEGGHAMVTFPVVNPTCDPVELEFVVDGFLNHDTNTRWVHAALEGNGSILPAGEARTIQVFVDLQGTRVGPGRYDGLIVVKTPFPKSVSLEVQVSL
jgi:hypothetical protein